MSNDTVAELPIPNKVTPEEALTIALRRVANMELVIIIYYCDECGSVHTLQGGSPSRSDVVWMTESVKMRCLAPVIQEEVEEFLERE